MQSWIVCASLLAFAKYDIAFFADALNNLKPDLILVLGDRYEIFAAVIPAMVARIPIVHLHGGELTEGLIDESIRHSITKMSQFHFVANEKYRNRVIQLGENPKNVFNVGGVGIDSINSLKFLKAENKPLGWYSNQISRTAPKNK